MLGYAARRVMLALPVIGIVAVVVFGLLYLTPGDPALVIAGDQASPEDVERIRVALGLDQPPYLRFAGWIGQVFRGDLGVSVFTQQPVTYMIGQRLEPSLALIGASMLLSVTVGMLFGVAAARRPGGLVDKALAAFVTIGFSVPVFILGYGLAYVFASRLHLFPVQGFTPLSQGLGPFLRSLALPAIAQSMVYAALIASVTRAKMISVLAQDFIRTARAKGVGPFALLFRHALKNASIPVLTIVGGGIATLIGATVVTENVFAIPGIGRLMTDAILHRDYPVIQGVVLLSSLAYVAVNLVVDLLYTVLDPRIRY